MYTGLTVAAIIIFIATLLPFWRNEAWWVRVFDFPRLQILFVAVAVLLCIAVFLDITDPVVAVMATILLICAGIQSWWVVPYSPIFPVEARPADGNDKENCIKILVANVLTPNRNYKGLLKLVADYSPDILATLETDSWWQQKLDTLEDEYRYTMKCPLDNLYGMHVYSRLSFSNETIEYLVEDDVPSMHALIKLRSGVEVRVHFLHPSPPVPNEREQSTERDAELVTVARSIAETDAPVIVTGDLNDVAWSATTRLFRKISGLLDPRIGRGMYNSFNAKYPFVRFPLDHLFHSDHFKVVSLCRLPKFGSDHFALLFELEYCSDRSAGEPSLRPITRDFELAEEKSDNKDMSKDDVPAPEKGN